MPEAKGIHGVPIFRDGGNCRDTLKLKKPPKWRLPKNVRAMVLEGGVEPPRPQWTPDP